MITLYPFDKQNNCQTYSMKSLKIQKGYQKLNIEEGYITQ